ncbi:MAG: hypothetical protein ACKKMW_02095 [Candidatus Nealsonbacteria bacterium]
MVEIDSKDLPKTDKRFQEEKAEARRKLRKGLQEALESSRKLSASLQRQLNEIGK